MEVRKVRVGKEGKEGNPGNGGKEVGNYGKKGMLKSGMSSRFSSSALAHCIIDLRTSCVLRSQIVPVQCSAFLASGSDPQEAF